MVSHQYPLSESEPLALDALFNPRSIAVIGASGREANPFSRPLRYLRSYGFDGNVYPINPSYEELEGARCYPDLAALPESIDLALLLVPAKVAIDLLPEVAAAGARVAILFASGFGETGEVGIKLQEQLLNTARANDIRIVGPNCQGAFNTTSNMFGTFTAALEDGPIRRGRLAYVGQSGAVGGSILSIADERGLGLSSWVSTGNQADLTSIDIARYLIDQDDTSVLALYIESAPNESQFVDLAARAAQRGKKLIVLRSARTSAGARAAASHTGAIVGDAAAFHATAKDYNVVIANDVDELVDFAHAATALPALNGPRIAVVTTSGGAGSLAADFVAEIGLELNELSAAAQLALSKIVPSFGAVENPIDVTAQIFRSSEVDDFIEVCRIVTELDEVDGLMIVMTLVTGEFAARMAHALVSLVGSSDKPIAITWAAARRQTLEARKILRDSDCPVFDAVGDAARALNSRLHREPRVPDRADPALTDDIGRLVENCEDTITEASGQTLLALAGVTTPRSWLASNAEQVKTPTKEISGPAVLKIQSPEILHKTEVGGVKVGVAADDLHDEVAALMSKFAAFPNEGVLIQEMAPAGLELIVGITKSVDGPALVTVGLGGTATELYRDTATALAPVSVARANELISETKASALLTGYRGEQSYDLGAVAEFVSRLSHLGVAVGPRLRELEVNPVRVTHDPKQPVVALDFLMRLETKEN